jgi:hypothetical protein
LDLPHWIDRTETAGYPATATIAIDLPHYRSEQQRQLPLIDHTPWSGLPIGNMVRTVPRHPRYSSPVTTLLRRFDLAGPSAFTLSGATLPVPACVDLCGAFIHHRLDGLRSGLHFHLFYL